MRWFRGFVPCLLLPAVVGCPARPAEPASAPAPEAKAVVVTGGESAWCEEHGVPESICTRCHADLIAKFKAANDWCAEHELPETQCTICHPDVRAKLAALRPAARAIDEESAWCAEHGVPESICTRCHADLIAKFKAANDWCAEHELPETQCTICHPDVRAKLAALRPAARALEGESKAAPRDAGRGVWFKENDPNCPVESAAIRFRDGGIAVKSGIAVEEARPRRMAASLLCPAEVHIHPDRMARVASRAPGIVSEVRVEAGAKVSKGQVLGTVESAALGEAKNRYLELRENVKLAELESARAALIDRGVARLLEECRPDVPGEQVRAKLADVRVGEAKSRLLKAHAALRLARETTARQDRLRADNATSEKNVEAARAELNGAEGDFLAAREEIAFNSQRAVQSAERTLRVARSSLDAAERHLHVLGLADAQIESVATEPGRAAPRYELRSPISGEVVDRHVISGDAAGEQSALFTVADLSRMWLVIDLRPGDAVCVRAGLPVVFSVDGAEGFTVEGRIVRLDSRVDDRARTLKAYAELPNDDGRLRENLFGAARIVLHAGDEVLSVPDEAIQTDGCCRLVFVRTSADTFQPRKVVVGARADGYAEIVSGLRQGEVVATTGGFLLKTEILKSNIGAGCCEVGPPR